MQALINYRPITVTGACIIEMLNDPSRENPEAREAGKYILL